MLTRKASASATAAVRQQTGHVLLPFLFSTPTICRHYHVRTSADRSSNSKSRSTRFRIQDREPRNERRRYDEKPVDRPQIFRPLLSAHATRNDAFGEYVGRDRNYGDADRPAYEKEEPEKQRGPHIPFDTRTPEQIEAGLDPEDLSRSTITPREQKVFERLFSMPGPQEAPAQVKGDGETSTPSEETRPPKPKLDIDTIIDASLRTIAQRAQKEQNARYATSYRNVEPEPPVVDEPTREYNAKIERSFQHAETDIDLWNRVHDTLLKPLAEIDLENPMQSTTSIDRDLLTKTLPQHLQLYWRVSTTNFPTSLQPLALLPTLRKLGPTAFAFAGSTPLYNSHMALMFAKFPTSLTPITDMLAEMDRQVYSFNAQTTRLLHRIIENARQYGSGDCGEALKALWTTEQVRRGMREVVRWRDLVEERRQEEALSKARQDEGNAGEVRQDRSYM